MAYAAGIIDGEGCIFAKAYLRKDNCFQTMLQVQVSMCSESVIKYLSNHFGGDVYTDIPQTGFVKYKRRFSWQVRGKRVGILLRALTPYLIEKRQRAELGIKLADLMSGAVKGKKNKLSEEERSNRIEIAATIKGFNRTTRSEDTIQ